MNPTLFAPALLLAAIQAQDPAARDPNHPLPATATSLQAVPPQLPAYREPAQVPATVVPQAIAQRRAARRPDATLGVSLPNQVLFDQPYANGPIWALGNSWKAGFDGGGMQFVPFFGADAPRNFPLRVSLASASVGGEPLPLQPGTPVVDGTVVRTARGPLVEVVQTTMRDVEQSFVFATLPNRGAIAVDIAIDTELACTSDRSGLRFGNEHGSVYYEKAIAVDAAGQSLPLAIVWDGDSAHIEIPAEFVARATLPLVLDPNLGANLTIGSGASATQLQRVPDVATIQSAGGRTCIVWRRQWSVGDNDCWAQILDDTMTPVTGLLNLDFSILDYRKVAIGGSYYAQNFLVAAEIGDGPLTYIGTRLVDAVGSVGGLTDLERDGVIGLPGNNFRPDVGGDAYNGTAAYYAVVFEKQNGTASDIYCKLVTQAGAPLTPNPTALDVSTTTESNPTISKSNGSVAGANYWFVAWQRTYPFAPFDQEVLGAYVNWNGTVTVPSIYIGSSVDNEAAPATSSPIDAEGNRYWVVAYERGAVGGAQRDIYCRAYDSLGNFMAFTDLSVDEGATSAPYDQQSPDIDSDGIRCAVTYAEPYIGLADLETKVSTIAYLPSTASFRIDDNRIGLGLSFGNESTPKICAAFSGGAQTSEKYVVVDANDLSNNLEAYLYGGYVTGTFFSYYPTQCGTLPITPSGSPVVGHTVQIDVANGPLSGTIFGFPGYIPLNPLGCNCALGVQQGLFMGNPLVFVVPANPVFVGTTLSVQGFTILGSQCLTNFDLSDTVDFTVL